MTYEEVVQWADEHPGAEVRFGSWRGSLIVQRTTGKPPTLRSRHATRYGAGSQWITLTQRSIETLEVKVGNRYRPISEVA